jgi:hypothetical protein
MNASRGNSCDDSLVTFVAFFRRFDKTKKFLFPFLSWEKKNLISEEEVDTEKKPRYQQEPSRQRSESREWLRRILSRFNPRREWCVSDEWINRSQKRASQTYQQWKFFISAKTSWLSHVSVDGENPTGHVSEARDLMFSYFSACCAVEWWAAITLMCKYAAAFVAFLQLLSVAQARLAQFAR